MLPVQPTAKRSPFDFVSYPLGTESPWLKPLAETTLLGGGGVGQEGMQAKGLGREHFICNFQIASAAKC